MKKKTIRFPTGSPEYYGHIGGKTRAEKLTPAKRKEIAQKAAFARWKGKKCVKGNINKE